MLKMHDGLAFLAILVTTTAESEDKLSWTYLRVTRENVSSPKRRKIPSKAPDRDFYEYLITIRRRLRSRLAAFSMSTNFTTVEE